MGALGPGKLLDRATAWSHQASQRQFALHKYNVRTRMQHE